MARLLSSSLLKGVTSLSAGQSSTIVSAASFDFITRFQVCCILKFSILPDDPGIHEDFKAVSKSETSGVSLKQIVEQDVKDNPVMIYMKGVPEFPQCGFSSLAVKVLKVYNVPLSARNILEDPELKTAVKAFSSWPTFPQLSIKGEFVGGSDIILNMHKSGELEEKLKDIAANRGETK